MIFIRSEPARRYGRHTAYRAQLRRDFRFRCAYCLTHERYLGGPAGCTIDHFRPVSGPHGRPDLVTEYANLYWTCRECNDNKSDTWPTSEQVELGLHFIDPCSPDGDHDLHWQAYADGSIEPLTPAGEFTIEHLMLWRDQLAYHRRRLYRWQCELDLLADLLARKRIPETDRVRLEARIVELGEYLDPPVFDRPTRRREGN
jgi:hypothetical protein